MSSLRKKKTAKNLPRRISTFTGGDDVPNIIGDNAKNRNRNKELMKRRYSSKIGPTLLAPEPNVAMPTNAMQTIQQHRSAPLITPKPVLDPNVFYDSDFDPDAYVKRVLSNASGEELDDFFNSLQMNKASAEAQMQGNVFHNYKEFIKISKEIRTFESDMSQLRIQMGELREVTDAFKEEAEPEEVEAPNGNALGRRGAQTRNSIVDFYSLQKTQLKALWSQVEGAQKCLPATENRRIIRESFAWTELNAATWRPKNRAHLVLLNDHLLVAQKRPKPSGSGQRLVVQHCFPLTEISAFEFEEEEMEESFCIRRKILASGEAAGRETFVYKADTKEEKRSMLQAILLETSECRTKRAREETVKRLTSQPPPEATSRVEQIRRLSLTLSRGRQASVAFGQDTEPVDLKWIQERIDDLDVRIAHQEYESACRSITKGRALVGNAGESDLALELTLLKLDERADRVAGLMCRELSGELAKGTRVVQLLINLVNIGKSELAKKTFLSSRSALIKRRLAGVIFEGDLPLYLSDCALVTFTLIRNTVATFESAFGKGPSTSGCVTWAKEEVKLFGRLMRRQLYGFDEKDPIYVTGIEAGMCQMEILRSGGMDLRVVLLRELELDATTLTEKPV